jgi:hypothetical protein
MFHMSAIEKFSLPSLPAEIKLAILCYLSHSEGAVLFTVSKEWSKYAPGFWQHRLMVDFALYAGATIPSVDLLDRIAINLINRFFQLHTKTSPLIGEKVLELYQPLSSEEAQQGFCNTYKKKYTTQETTPVFRLAWSSFLATKGSNPEQNQAVQRLGISIISSDSIKYARISYQLLMMLSTDLRRHIGYTQSLLDKLDKAIEQEESRRKRSKYLRIFLYALGGIISVFIMFKLARTIHSTGVFSKNSPQ